MTLWYDPNDKHRHVSHLFALFPGRQISMLETPELAEAARVSLNARGDASTGWSRAWKINFWARLGDGNRAHKLLRSLINLVEETGTIYGDSGGGVYPNLLCSHPHLCLSQHFKNTFSAMCDCQTRGPRMTDPSGLGGTRLRRAASLTKNSLSPPMVFLSMCSNSSRFSPLVLKPPTCRVCSNRTTDRPSLEAEMAEVMPPGVVVAAGAALAWLVSGSETLLMPGLGGGLLLGLAGVWRLLHQLERAVKQLHCETPGLG